MSKYKFLVLGNYLVRNSVNEKKKNPAIKFGNYPCKLKRKKSPHKEEEIKYGIPEFRSRRKK